MFFLSLVEMPDQDKLLAIGIMRIKDLCPEERPREKLRQKGGKTLSPAELLAILLGSGSGGKNALEIAQELMVEAGGRLCVLGAWPLERLMNKKGVGETRAIAIAAAFELGRRAFEERAVLACRSVTTPEMVYQLMIPHLKNIDHEQCWVVYLNNAHFVLGQEMITSGSLESTLIDKKRIIRRAIEKQSSKIILVHNHPSGSPRPGIADINQTEMLRKALAPLEILLLDHIIVADKCFYSFSEERVGRME